MKLFVLLSAIFILAFLMPSARPQSTDVIIISDAYLTYNNYDIKALSGSAGQNAIIEIKKGSTVYPLYNLTVGEAKNIPDLNFSVFVKNVTKTPAGNISIQATLGPYVYPAVKKKAYIETTYSPSSADNTTFKILATYSENSTGLFKLIPNGSCAISFSDDIQPKPMTFSADKGHDYTKFFNGTSLNYTVNCFSANYTSEDQTKQINVNIIVTEVALLNPKTTVSTRNVSFVCEVRGQKPDRINLYTDTSGEWRIRASADVTTKSSPYRVQFTENNVDDGEYFWNCEAEVGQAKIAASSNQPFSVKFVSHVTLNCNNENVDCTSWSPDICPSSGKFTRSCNNTDTCNYDLEKSCAAGSVASSPLVASEEPPVETSKPSAGKTGASKPSEGIDTITIVLILAVIVVIVVIFIKLRKGRKENKEIEELGGPEEEFENDNLRPDEGGGMDGGEDDKGETGSKDDKGEEF